MKRKIILFSLGLLLTHVGLGAKNYYVGSNELRSGEYPNLESLKGVVFRTGDTIYLAGGITFQGRIHLKNVTGAVVTSFGGRATIDCAGYSEGIFIEDCADITINAINITGNGQGENVQKSAQRKNMRCAIVAAAQTGGRGCENVVIENVLIKDLFYFNKGYKRPKEEVRTANGTEAYGYGIRAFCYKNAGGFKGLSIKNCRIEHVSHTGVKLAGPITDVIVAENSVYRTGGPGLQMSGPKDIHMYKNTVEWSGSADDSRKWGRGSGFWCWGVDNLVFEHNKITNANGPGDSAGAHIDFNCKNVMFQYNFFANNAGGFVEILGNNHNCTYRYNISVNDGWRVKGEYDAFQQGKVLWTSGYVGKKKEQHGPYNSYIYNNTIYVSPGKTSNIALGSTSQGVFIANNIFCFDNSMPVLGDQYRPEKGGGVRKAKGVIIANNLYLNASTWGKNIAFQERDRMYGDPQFVLPGGSSKSDYVPQNTALIKDKGVKIQRLAGDKIGIKGGFDMKYDILGNPIVGAPDMGAIELD